MTYRKCQFDTQPVQFAPNNSPSQPMMQPCSADLHNKSLILPKRYFHMHFLANISIYIFYSVYILKQVAACSSQATRHYVCIYIYINVYKDCIIDDSIRICLMTRLKRKKVGFTISSLCRACMQFYIQTGCSLPIIGYKPLCVSMCRGICDAMSCH